MRLQVEYVEPESLQAAPYNPRTMSHQALQALARLLDEHGFVDPVIARREDGLLISGHQRIRAHSLRRDGEKLIPCVFLSGLTDAQAKALNIALNNPSAQGRYDDGQLAGLLVELGADGLDVPAVTGFSSDEIAQIDTLLDEYAPPDIDPPLGTEAGAEDSCGRTNTVVVIFEMPEGTYLRAKPRLDELINEYDLTCRVRFDQE